MHTWLSYLPWHKLVCYYEVYEWRVVIFLLQYLVIGVVQIVGAFLFLNFLFDYLLNADSFF